MAEQTIVRTQIIVVDVVGENSYGDLTFTDKEGTAYKIPVKRKQYFEKIIIPDMAVQLNYAMSSFNKEYIYSAVQVKGELPPPQKPYEPPATAMPIKADRDSIIEAQVGIKSITEIFIAGKIEELITSNNPFVVALKIWLAEKLNPYMMPTIAPQEKEQSKIEPTLTYEELAKPNEPQTFAELRAAIIALDKTFTLTWMVNTVKIPEAELKAKPNECFHKIKKFIGKEGK